MTRTARCCCGACSIELRGEPVVNAICHCTNCRQRTGSAFGWSAYFADEQITRRDGQFKMYVIDHDRQQRSFCAQCGTTLFWKVRNRRGVTGVAGGCFIGAPLPAPTATVCNDGRCDWLTLPSGWKTTV